MNIPVIPIADVQGLPAGTTQAVLGGSAAGSTQDEFALTFGVTLRQSGQPDGGLLQSGNAAITAGAEPGTLAAELRARLGTNGLKPAESSVKGAGSGAASLSTGEVEVVGEGESAGGAREGTGDLVASKVDAATEKTAVFKASKVHQAKTQSQGPTPVDSIAKSRLAGTKLTAIADRSEATLAGGDGSAALAAFVDGLPPNLVLAQLQSVVVGPGAVAGADSALVAAPGVLIDPQPNTPAAVTNTKDEPAADLKVSAASVPSDGQGHAVAGKSAAWGTPVKGLSAKNAAKPGPEAGLAGTFDVSKAGVEDTASSSLNVSAAMVASQPLLAVMEVPKNLPLAETPMIGNGVGMEQSIRSTKEVNPSQGQGATLRAPSQDDGETAVLKMDVTLEGVFPVASKITAESASVAEIAASSSQSHRERVGGAVQTLAPGTRVPGSLPAITALAVDPQPDTVDKSVKTLAQVVAQTVASVTGQSDVESATAEQADSRAAVAGDLRKEAPIEAATSAAGVKTAASGLERPVSQAPIERTRQLAESPAKQLPALSELAGVPAGAGTLSATNVHVADRVVTALEPGPATPPAVVGVQVIAQGAVVAPHTTNPTASPNEQTSSSGGVSALEASRHAAGVAPAESFRTIAATPTTLEVGVPDGTQGWLRIRAEVGDQGLVSASLAAGSNAGQEILHRQLPALNAYLHAEQIPVTASVADRVFAATGGSLAGMAAGSDASGRSGAGTDGQTLGQGNQDATANQGSQNGQTMSLGTPGGGTQQRGDQRVLLPALDGVTARQSGRSYDSHIGVNDVDAARARQNGDSGRWLNVRA